MKSSKEIRDPPGYLWVKSSFLGGGRGGKRPARLYDRLNERRFEFIPLWGYRVFLVYLMRRLDCADCGVKVEQVPWARGKRKLTDTYQQFLAHRAKKLSWKEVAISFQTSWEKVFDAVEYMVQWGLEHRELSGITAIGVDEIAWRKGHHYLTMVYQIDAGNTRLLWVGKDRTVKTFLRFFRFFGKERSQALSYVCSDMRKPYIKVIEKKAVQAFHILDRFHIVAKLNKAIDKARRGFLARDEDNDYLALETSDDGAMQQLYGHSITYRIALRPQQGRKVFTLQSLPPIEEPKASSSRVANMAGFSLHAGVMAEAYQRDKLERLCRYIARVASIPGATASGSV